MPLYFASHSFSHATAMTLPDTWTVSKGGTFNRILILTDALDADYTAEYS